MSSQTWKTKSWTKKKNKQAVVRGTTNRAPCCHLANATDWAMAGDNKLAFDPPTHLPELTQNLIRLSHGQSTPSLKISRKSVQPFSRNVADKEINKEIQGKQYPVPLPRGRVKKTSDRQEVYMSNRKTTRHSSESGLDRQMERQTDRQTDREMLCSCLIGLFFKNYSSLGYSRLGRSQTFVNCYDRTLQAGCPSC